MGLLNNIVNVCSANMVGSALPTYIYVGISGTTFSSGQTGLGSVFTFAAINNADLSQGSQVTFVANFNPIQMSGCVMREYGVVTSGGVYLNREVLTSPITFDGLNELQVQQTFKFYH